MGRWVTSKGRRIYIPDKGEENPYAKKEKPLSSKNDYNAVIRDAKSKEELMEIAKEIGNNSDLSSETRDKLMGSMYEKAQSLKDQINKDFDTKEKQIANNKEQNKKDALGGNKSDKEYRKVLEKHIKEGTNIPSAEDIAKQTKDHIKESEEKYGNASMKELKNLDISKMSNKDKELLYTNLGSREFKGERGAKALRDKVHQSLKEDSIKNQINKDFDLKEKQIADNAKQRKEEWEKRKKK